MKLIDADELLERMYRYTDNEGAKMPYGDSDSLIHKDSACFLIENTPTIEPERKKGKWVKDNYGNTVCSECLGIRRDNRRNYTNFCNQCGADMRGYSDEKCMDV